MIDPSAIRITSVSLRRTESFHDRMGNEQYGLTAEVQPGQSATQVTLALQTMIDAHFRALGLLYEPDQFEDEQPCYDDHAADEAAAMAHQEMDAAQDADAAADYARFGPQPDDIPF
jgi:hypothetical protein